MPPRPPGSPASISPVPTPRPSLDKISRDSSLCDTNGDYTIPSFMDNSDDVDIDEIQAALVPDPDNKALAGLLPRDFPPANESVSPVAGIISGALEATSSVIITAEKSATPLAENFVRAPSTPDQASTKDSLAAISGKRDPRPFAAADATVAQSVLQSHRASDDKLKTFASEDFSTPLHPTTHAGPEFGKQEAIRELLKAELGSGVKVTAAWAHSLYHDLAPPDEVDRYLRTCKYYRKGRWALPLQPRSESELYEPYRNFINSIIAYFGLEGREAIDTHSSKLKHENTGQKSSPDISVKASGPSFVNPPGARVGYGNMAGYFDGKLDSKVTHNHIVQMGVYARQTLIQQPNRFFVRSLIVTEHRVCLYHFDRSGVQFTEPFNIHEHPITFVRLILGLCSTDERALGLDVSVQWKVDAAGVRIGGTLITTISGGKATNSVEYDLDLMKIPFCRGSVRGRGTTCWPIKDRKSGKEYIVKDYWMSEGRTPEYEILEQLEGIPGVCQMLSYEWDRGETKDFRGETKYVLNGTFHNRKAVRIVMELYGESIDNFVSAKELLSAFRDAISAHHKLLKKGIVHRDLSNNNILLGPDPNQVGHRGIIIDFDMAAPASGRSISDISKDFRTGTPLFYSLIMLMCIKFAMPAERRPAHDFLDDFEAFFWLFSYLIFTYKANGEDAPGTQINKYEIKKWNDPAAHVAYTGKFEFLRGTTLDNDILLKEALDESWHHTCLELFNGFKAKMNSLSIAREALLFTNLDPLPDGTVPNRFSSVLEHADEYYAHVLSLFDAALDKANNAPSTLAPRARRRPRTLSLPSLRSLPPSVSAGRGSKRRSQETAEEESPTKPKPKRAKGRSQLSQTVTNADDD